MSILIQNGTLLLPEGPARADLRLEGDKIAQIGPGLPVEDSRVVDASGRLVFPGFIDTHTHFEMNKGTDRETADDWATGTRAALAGGTGRGDHLRTGFCRAQAGGRPFLRPGDLA